MKFEVMLKSPLGDDPLSIIVNPLNSQAHLSMHHGLNGAQTTIESDIVEINDSNITVVASSIVPFNFTAIINLHLVSDDAWVARISVSDSKAGIDLMTFEAGAKKVPEQ